MHRYLLLALAVVALFASCRQSPTARQAPPVTFQSPATSSPTTAPASRPAVRAERPPQGFTHYVTADTALMRRGTSDGDVVYDTISANARVNITGASGRYATITTADGRNGLISANRIRRISGPIINARALSRTTPVVNWRLPAAAPARPAFTPLSRTRSSKQIQDAVDKACQYLASQQLLDGSWDDSPPGGIASTRWLTALVGGTLAGAQGEAFKGRGRAQIAVHLDNESETFTLAFRDQLHEELFNTVATRTGALDLLRCAMTRDTNVKKNLADTLFGDYIDSASHDPINSYFAIASIAAGEQHGMEVPYDFWKDAQTQWRDRQLLTGGWSSDGFSPAGPADFYGTAAGFMALSIALERHPGQRSQSVHFTQHTGNYIDRDLQAAAAWLNNETADVWSQVLGGNLEQPCQTTWWLDQVMTEAGAIRLNQLDDVTQILHWLLRTQQADGSWPGDLSETAYAVRVLKNHLRPAGITKLAYGSWGQDGCWNQRPGDVLHISRWLDRHLSMQGKLRNLVMDIGNPQEDLDASPILFVAGDSEFKFGQGELEKLRKYVEQGGLIVGNADLASPGFCKSFETLGGQLFPDYKFRDLPENHPIYKDQIYPERKWKERIHLRGVSNSIRELMILIPEADVSLAWQTDSFESDLDSFQLFADIYTYINGFRDVAPARELPAPAPQRATSGHPMGIARIKLADNPNPEPAAWARMADIMQNAGLRLDVTDSQLEPRSLELCKLAHLTGTTRFTFTREQRQQLHDFVINGGALLIDAAGGSAEFADAAQAELKEIFGDDARPLAEPMPAEILFAKPGGLAPLNGNPSLFRRRYRLPAAASDFTTQLRVMKVGNRMAVFFSRQDLTAAMAGIQSDNIDGYKPEVGTELVRNILKHVDEN